MFGWLDEDEDDRLRLGGGRDLLECDDEGCVLEVVDLLVSRLVGAWLEG